MKHLISISYNKIFKKEVQLFKEEQELTPYYEIVLILDKALYKLNNNREVVRERELEEARFTVSEKSLDFLIGELEKMKKDK
jgi:hypothetical protein